MARGQHATNEVSGRPLFVRLAGPEIATDTLLPALASGLRSAGKAISIVANTCDEASGFAGLARGDIDVYLHVYLTTPPPADVTWIDLLDDELVVMMSPDDPMAGADRVPLPQVLDRHLVAGPVYTGTFRADLLEILMAAGEPRVVYQSPTYAGAFAFVASGEAISMHFKRIAPPFERSHVLSRPLLEPIEVVWGAAVRHDADPVLGSALAEVAEDFGARLVGARSVGA